MIFRANLFLLLILVICALSTVTAQHRARKLYQSLESSQDMMRQMEDEFGQLQLEMSTWAMPLRIEKIAKDRLRMQVPDALGRLRPLETVVRGR